MSRAAGSIVLGLALALALAVVAVPVSDQAAYLLQQSILRQACYNPHAFALPAGMNCTELAAPTEQEPMTAAYNYALALQHTTFFYEAQRSGKLPSNNRVSWRGDSFMDDGRDIGKDLTGGWFDAGDRVKSTQTISFAATALAWATLEFADGFSRANSLEYQLNNLVWAAEYLVKCHLGPEELVAQAGDFIWDHEWWGPPENIPSDSNAIKRPTYTVDARRPGSEVSGQTAAAMAAISVVLRKHRPSSSAFADDLLNRAKQLYAFAVKYPNSINNLNPSRQPHVFPQVGNGQEFYWSYSGFQDEVAWAATWLHVAGAGSNYWNEAVKYFDARWPWEGDAFDWDNKWPAVKAMMAKYGPSGTDLSKYHNAAQANLDYWSNPNSGMKYTPGGLVFFQQWGSARYAGLMSFVAVAYASYPGVPSNKVSNYVNFAIRQIDYMLGSNPFNRSLMVGFGNNPPLYCHHGGASGYYGWGNDGFSNPNPNRNVIYGALVGGPYCDPPQQPHQCDTYKDKRDDYIRNEVALDYSAGITGALARLVMLSSNVHPDPNF
eukprot:TRINITY_DN17294_c0_g1_i1.p1 TRINITY_DN17294_c0_g1~~TRINITY_DN17294_c0_g1_i1.p1  ORF type:complete len:548 (-),score=113.39 TRINITY_DN17294_c0_g1_i1:66-1709(-)